jgi:hypothetical protein
MHKFGARTSCANATKQVKEQVMNYGEGNILNMVLLVARLQEAGKARCGLVIDGMSS